MKTQVMDKYLDLVESGFKLARQCTYAHIAACSAHASEERRHETEANAERAGRKVVTELRELIRLLKETYPEFSDHRALQIVEQDLDRPELLSLEGRILRVGKVIARFEKESVSAFA